MTDATTEPAIVERLDVDTTLYSEAAIFRSAYKFTERAYISLSRKQPSTIVVELRNKEEGHSVGAVAGAFWNELIDQQIRCELAAETRSIRDWVVAQAFVESDLPQPILFLDEKQSPSSP